MRWQIRCIEPGLLVNEVGQRSQWLSLYAAASKIPMTTIDAIMSEYDEECVVLIKMDIEGSELNALIGAKQTIDRHKPPILIEINEEALNSCGTSPFELEDFFRSQGYEGFLIDRTEKGKAFIKDIPSNHQHVTDEALFVHISKLDSTIERLNETIKCED